MSIRKKLFEHDLQRERDALVEAEPGAIASWREAMKEERIEYEAIQEAVIRAQYAERIRQTLAQRTEESENSST